MAELAEDLLTAEERTDRAKEYFNRGSRNYLVKDYSEAAEDLSRACEMYAEIYGNESDEIGLPFLYYAKTLIALAQRGENKVLTIEEVEEGDDDADGDGETEGGGGGDDDDDDESDEPAQTDEKNGKEAPKEDEKVAGDDPQPGTSSGQPSETNGATKNGTENGGAEEEDEVTNLQCAWESLEMAVKIFQRIGESALPNLADAHFELGEISLENGHYAEAIQDYGKKIDIGNFTKTGSYIPFLCFQIFRLKSA